jgi:hypothetical protein
MRVKERRTKMRKAITILLMTFSIILLASCSENNGGNGMSNNSINANQSIESLFQMVCSADDALELSKKTSTVVFERRGCTSGNEVWDAFYQAVSSESPASVLCAHYYVLDKEHMSEELYEEEKDQYPKLFFYLIEYDGKEYSVKTRESTVEAIDDQETFKDLLHFTGEAPATALYSTYDNYVLVDDSSATWEGIVAGMVSSQFGAGYKHCTEYRNYSFWSGD